MQNRSCGIFKSAFKGAMLKLRGLKLRALALLPLAGALAACAPGAEFQVAPQQGAWRGGAYPSFSQKPEAETAQFTAEDKTRLSSRLRADGQNLRAQAYAEDKAQKAAGSAGGARKQANQEIEDTLRQIKNSGK